jgi:hypothetical protein
MKTQIISIIFIVFVIFINDCSNAGVKKICGFLKQALCGINGISVDVAEEAFKHKPKGKLIYNQMNILFCYYFSSIWWKLYKTFN